MTYLKNQKSKNKTGRFIAISVVVIVAIVGFYNFGYVKAVFYNIIENHYNVGDKISINDKSISNSGNHIYLYQLIKNKTAPYDIYWRYTPFLIHKGDMYMHKTNSLGSYIGYKIITLHPKTSSKITIRFYAIKPNWKIVTNHELQIKMRPGYTLLDDNYYLSVSP